MKRFTAISVIIGCFFISSSLWADTAITSLPYEINVPGNYYIENDLSSAGFGIIIRASDVTIDLRGNSLVGSDADYGIYAWQPRNVEVKNGTVRKFRTGVASVLTVLTSFKVTDVGALNNVSAGISLASANNIIKDCIAANNGGTGISAGKNSNAV